MIDLEQLKQRNDILDVVANYVKLRKTGIEHVGLCPFHHEKTPSFYVNPQKQLFHCHGCNVGGDVISFMQQIEHVTFREAAKLLASRCGMEFDDKPLTRQEKVDWARVAEQRELVQHFALTEHLPLLKAREEFEWLCEHDKGYRGYLKRDLKFAKEITWAVVKMLEKAEEKNPLYSDAKKD